MQMHMYPRISISSEMEDGSPDKIISPLFVWNFNLESKIESMIHWSYIISADYTYCSQGVILEASLNFSGFVIEFLFQIFSLNVCLVLPPSRLPHVGSCVYMCLSTLLFSNGSKLCEWWFRGYKFSCHSLFECVTYEMFWWMVFTSKFTLYLPKVTKWKRKTENQKRKIKILAWSHKFSSLSISHHTHLFTHVSLTHTLSEHSICFSALLLSIDVFVCY